MLKRFWGGRDVLKWVLRVVLGWNGCGVLQIRDGIRMRTGFGLVRCGVMKQPKFEVFGEVDLIYL